MTTACVVQARMGASRLPGKVLLPLNGRTVLSHVLGRCGAIEGVDVLCCAVPYGAENDPVADEARRHGAMVMRGSERDVLDRYLQAAVAVRADVIVRVTADCPLIDSKICAGLLKARDLAAADYASNVWPRTWPKGLDCEVFTMETLVRAAAAAKSPVEREHVTAWMIDASEISQASYVNGGGPNRSALRWTLDYQEDMVFLTALFSLLPDDMADYASVLGVVEANPEITALNACWVEGQNRKVKV